MTKKKPFYEQPSCDLLVVRFEENIMSPNNPIDQNGTQRSTVNDPFGDDWSNA